MQHFSGSGKLTMHGPLLILEYSKRIRHLFPYHTALDGLSLLLGTASTPVRGSLATKMKHLAGGPDYQQYR